MSQKYENMDFFQFQKRFSREDFCLKHLVKLRWPDGFVCPRCGHDKAGFHSKRKLLQCKGCRYQASATAGTIFHRTKIPLRKWFWFIFLISSQKTGVSIQGLQRLLGIKSYKTAWTMAHKVRKAMADRDASYQLANLVEMDDSYFGPSGRGKRGRGSKGKVPVVVAVENRGKKPGFAAMRVVDNLKSAHIAHFAQSKIKEQQTVRTDGYVSYYCLSGYGYELDMRIVGNGPNASKELPWVHTLIANVKSMLRGAHHGVSHKYLQRYLDEFCYRFNRRYWPSQLFNRLLKAALVTPAVTYAELST
jgi:transposase-like protein